METAYRCSKQGNRYTVETLVHFVKNLHIKHHDYIRSTFLQKIFAVTLVDRKPLHDYLLGKISNTDAIQFLAPPDNPNFPNLNDFVDEFDLQNDNSTVGNAYENVNPIEMLKSIERSLRDWESILECRHRDFHSVLRRLPGGMRRGKNRSLSRGRTDCWK